MNNPIFSSKYACAIHWIKYSFKLKFTILIFIIIYILTDIDIYILALFVSGKFALVNGPLAWFSHNSMVERLEY